MNVTIHVVERLHRIVEEIKQERETDSGDERQDKRDHHVSDARRSNRAARYAGVSLDADFTPLVALRDLNFTEFLLESRQILFVGFEPLRIGGHFDLIASLLGRDRALLFVSALNAL